MQYSKAPILFTALVFTLLIAGTAWATTGCRDAQTNLDIALDNRNFAESARDLACGVNRPEEHRQHGRHRYHRFITDVKVCQLGIRQVALAVQSVQQAAEFFEECKRRGRI